MKPNATSFRVAYERTAIDAAANPRPSQTARARMSNCPRAMHVNLRKVFTKLGINSRAQLARVLPDEPNAG
jgi:hypothetical protein